ncbi:uncharacterized protein LOC107827011 [Nicotiana tabacum]|uniref:Uncharacterized protein LOC107827011 n=1 Tax=Nicotiana tabacum TaxID=4097 RepID=A0AC58TNR2_TOBAC
MMKKLLLDNQKVMAENQQLRTEFRNLERQFGQMANNKNIRPVGALPSDTEKNPQVNAATLRNGRELVEVPKNKRSSLGSFTIPVRIGEIDVGRALCDLGGSINLMPLLVFKQLGLVASRPTTVLLQLSDRSYVYPEGVIADVLLHIGKFIFPADFIILDYEVDELVPIILERPLLATGDAIIKVREGKMIPRVDNEEAVFNVYRAIQLPRHYKDLAMISVVKINAPAIEASAFKEDALEKTLMLFNHLELEEEVEELLKILDASCEHIRERSQFEPLDRVIGLPSRPSVEEAPKLELKPLTPHLHYAYLGSSNTLPVIVSSHLSKLQEEKLLRVLREHKHAIG